MVCTVLTPAYFPFIGVSHNTAFMKNGDIMFTFGDVKNIAVQIERNGEESYLKASKVSTDPKVTEMLLWMAEQERKHANWFSSLKSSKPLTAEQKTMEAVGQTLLQDMVKGNDFLLEDKNLEKSKSVKEVLDISISFEEDTILFYNFLVDFLDDEEDREQLQRIIAEEQSHITQLEQMLAKINDPCDKLSC
ncbi:MAG: rubrerythrin [Desulforhopalus sp.]|jgi:rubrerythrin